MLKDKDVKTANTNINQDWFILVKINHLMEILGLSLFDWYEFF